MIMFRIGELMAVNCVLYTGEVPVHKPMLS